MTRLGAAAARIVAAVEEIHQPLDALDCGGGQQRVRQVCTGCGTDSGNWQIWPCPTIRAVRRTLSAETTCEVYFDSDCAAQGDIAPCPTCIAAASRPSPHADGV